METRLAYPTKVDGKFVKRGDTAQILLARAGSRDSESLLESIRREIRLRLAATSKEASLWRTQRLLPCSTVRLK